jgi:hypothetical protein
VSSELKTLLAPWCEQPQVFLTEMVVAVSGAAMCQRRSLQMSGSVEASLVKFGTDNVASFVFQVTRDLRKYVS